PAYAGGAGQRQDGRRGAREGSPEWWGPAGSPSVDPDQNTRGRPAPARGLGHRASRSKYRIDRLPSQARGRDGLPLLEARRAPRGMVASTRDGDRRPPATLAAAEDDGDDEERQQDRGDHQPDDAEQPASLRSIVTLVAVRRRANFTD